MLPPIPHTDGVGGNGGWAICDADPIRFIGVCRRAPSRPSKSPWHTRGLFGLAACLVSFQPGSNRRPSASEADALSTELWNVGGFSTRTYYASVGLAGFEPATSRPLGQVRYRTAPQSARTFLPTGGGGTPLWEPRDRETCPACEPPAGFEPATSVKRALSTELQGRMPSRRGGVATRLPIRRHSHHLFASCHGVAIAMAFAYWDDGVYRAFHASA